MLYLLADWRGSLREARDLIKPGGGLFHEWGNGDDGEPWVQVREKARALSARPAWKPVPSRVPGRRRKSTRISSSWASFAKSKVEVGPDPNMTLCGFLGKIESGELSYVWNVPRSVRDACLPRLRRRCQQSFELDRLMPVPAAHRWVVYLKGRAPAPDA
jgi:hypothetical protein